MIKPERRIYLASRSPRRKQLLDQIGVAYEVIHVDVEELRGGDEPVEGYVTRVAAAKAEAAAAVISYPLPILAADTEVVLDNRILGKPPDRHAAVEMLMSLSGRAHRVLTAVVLLHDRLDYRASESRVWFKALTVRECEAYCDSEMPYDKAGGYGIQDKAAVFISRIEGSYSGIMGLPLYETAQLLSNEVHSSEESPIQESDCQPGQRENTKQTPA